ncbi:unnamed protein product [Trichogramma brassicae]|uniref:Uncharacterized protein n=1 Tax=Trichogramma brassicae TaxID=86971 RepID=A0A6H5I7U1_9HYME|nr:unnamed protein product [Trichogramma brassicae]
MFEYIFDAIYILQLTKLYQNRGSSLPPQRTSIRMRCNTILREFEPCDTLNFFARLSDCVATASQSVLLTELKMRACPVPTLLEKSVPRRCAGGSNGDKLSWLVVSSFSAKMLDVFILRRVGAAARKVSRAIADARRTTIALSRRAAGRTPTVVAEADEVCDGSDRPGVHGRTEMTRGMRRSSCSLLSMLSVIVMSGAETVTGIPVTRTSQESTLGVVVGAEERDVDGDYIAILHRRSKFYIGPARGQFFDRRPSETLCFLYGMMSGQSTISESRHAETDTRSYILLRKLAVEAVYLRSALAITRALRGTRAYAHMGKRVIQQTPAIAEHAISNRTQYNFIHRQSFPRPRSAQSLHGQSCSCSNLTRKYGMHSLVNMYSDATARAGPCCNTSVGSFPRRRFPRDKKKNIIHLLCRANKIARGESRGSQKKPKKKKKRRRAQIRKHGVKVRERSSSLLFKTHAFFASFIYYQEIQVCTLYFRRLLQRERKRSNAADETIALLAGADERK